MYCLHGKKGRSLVLSGGVLAILVHAAVDSVFREPALVLILILCGSLVLVMKRIESPDLSLYGTFCFLTIRLELP